MFQYSKNDVEHVGRNMSICAVNPEILLILIDNEGGINNPNGTEIKSSPKLRHGGAEESF